MYKNIKRRGFLANSFKASIALNYSGVFLSACKAANEGNPNEDNKLSILILGGTSFLGPHQIAYALERGHKITTFTRGKTRPTVHQELFDQVNMLTGDRENDLSALEEGNWDVVIDNSGRTVEWTRKTAELLKDRVGMYLYTSSTGVYYPYLGDNISEETELLTIEPEGIEDEDMKIEYWYGVMKTNSEIAARNAFGDNRTIVVRPTYMVGPADKSNRFIHWPIRLAKGGEVLVPGKEDDPVQYVDVRDVAEFMIRLIEEKKSGTYNAVGPGQPQTMYEFVQQAKSAFETENELVYVDDYEFLKDNGVEYIVPWIPPLGNNYGSSRSTNTKAISAGLTFRPLVQTMKDTHDWWYSDALSQDKRDEYEKNPENVLNREKVILEKWDQRH